MGGDGCEEAKLDSKRGEEVEGKPHGREEVEGRRPKLTATGNRPPTGTGYTDFTWTGSINARNPPFQKRGS